MLFTLFYWYFISIDDIIPIIIMRPINIINNCLIFDILLFNVIIIISPLFVCWFVILFQCCVLHILFLAIVALATEKNMITSSFFFSNYTIFLF